MGIDVTFVLTDTYKDWPKIRQVPRRPILGHVSCARAGLNRLAGPVSSQIAPTSVPTAILQ